VNSYGSFESVNGGRRGAHSPIGGGFGTGGGLPPIPPIPGAGGVVETRLPHARLDIILIIFSFVVIGMIIKSFGFVPKQETVVEVLQEKKVERLAKPDSTPLCFEKDDIGIVSQIRGRVDTHFLISVLPTFVVGLGAIFVYVSQDKFKMPLITPRDSLSSSTTEDSA